MTKYCHECGVELLTDTSKFCSKCGAKTTKDETTSKTQEEEKPVQYEKEPEEKVNRHSVLNGIVLFAIAFTIILYIYIVPMGSVGGRSFSIADLNHYCSITLINVVAGSECSFYTAVFYIVWITAIILIVLGIIETALAIRD